MDDRELSKFIPRNGDLVLVRSFLRKQNSPNTRNPKRKSKGVEEESLPKLLLPRKSVKIDEQHEKEQTDEKEQDENDLTHSVGTDIIAEAMLSSGVADFDSGDSLDSIPDFFEHVTFLEPENIDVPGDFSLPVEEPVTLNEALTQNQDGPMVLDDFRVSHPYPMITQVFLRRRRLQGTCLELELAGRRMDVHRAYYGKGLPGPPNFPPTTIVIAFGEETVTSADLFNSFLHFVSQTDRHLIQAVLKDDLKGEDKDELLDLLESFQCSINPSKDNMKSIIDKIPHKELIQKPKYAMDNMAMTCRETFMGTFLSVDKLLEIYVNLEPTPRQFLKLLKASPITNAENASLRVFQQYRLFITVPKIDISFTQLEEFNRRPIAHTCGPSLELPSTYSSYPELKLEMDSILSDDSCFVINIA
ncbi:unnamed protein product [Mytilus coruscus]|uniref:HECT domain-containing protein n=1 Tax=Mytilus coruscus TaxID=42192 RepID=A0A6J8F144_MYTCO|nr:unnamed protein product [Mytilus coruscus]